MSAPPVPTSSRVSSGRCAARASMRRLGQARAAEPAVHPAQVAQVRREGRRVVERTVEELEGVGAAIHRGSVRRARTMALVIVVAGEALIDLLIGPDGRVTETPGGGPFNTARAIGRLGLDVDFLGRLSTDRSRPTARRCAGRGRGRPATARPRPKRRRRWREPPARRGRDGHLRFVLAGTSAVGLTIEEARAALAGPTGGPPRRVAGPGRRADRVGARRRPSRETGARTLVMVDPNCRPAAIPDRRGVRRPPAGRPRSGRRRQGQRGRPRLPRAGAIAGRAARRARRGRRRAVVCHRRPGPGQRRRPHASRFEVPVAAGPRSSTRVGAGDAFGGALLARWIVERGLRTGRAGRRRRRPRGGRARDRGRARDLRRVPAPIRRAAPRLGWPSRRRSSARLWCMPTATRRLPARRPRRRSCSLSRRRAWRPSDLDLPDAIARQPRRRRPGDPGPAASHHGQPVAIDGVFGTATRTGQGVPGRRTADRRRRRPRGDLGQARSSASGRAAAARRSRSSSACSTRSASRADGDGVLRGGDADRGQRLPAPHGHDRRDRVGPLTWRKLVWHYDHAGVQGATACATTASATAAANWGTGAAIGQLEAAARAFSASAAVGSRSATSAASTAATSPATRRHEVGLDVDIRPMRDAGGPVHVGHELAVVVLRPGRHAGPDQGDPRRGPGPRQAHLLQRPGAHRRGPHDAGSAATTTTSTSATARRWHPSSSATAAEPQGSASASVTSLVNRPGWRPPRTT